MDQHTAIKYILDGHNILLTGAPGTGKSYIINQCIELLKQQGKKVAITASTGIAASHINGVTIHSWSGIGIKSEDELLNRGDVYRISDNEYVRERVENCDVLIIDEVSMLHAHQLTAVDIVCKAVKGGKFRNKLEDLPFGGLQVILVGDFLQLPPVSTNSSRSKYAFESIIWDTIGIKVCYLTKQYRQKDMEFLNILNEIRGDRVTQKSRDKLLSRLNQPIKNFKDPMKLFTLNRDVDAMNNYMLSQINAREEQFIMSSSGNPHVIKTLKKQCLAPEILKLKIGALVMFLRNNPRKGYINGSLGTVIRFNVDDNYPEIKLYDGNIVKATPENWKISEDKIMKVEGNLVVTTTTSIITQVPLKLAYAATIHKIQGFSLDCAEMDLSNIFAPGMGYVALSRVRTLEGISLTGFDDAALCVDNIIMDIDKFFHEQSKKLEN